MPGAASQDRIDEVKAKVKEESAEVVWRKKLRDRLREARKGVDGVEVTKQALSARDKSITKIAKLLNRLRRLSGEPSSDGTISEMKKLNVTMYSSELASALSDGTSSMKVKDVHKTVEVITELICTYGVDMGRHIMLEFVKQFEASIGELSRRRVLSRIVTEMVLTNCTGDDNTEALDMLQTVVKGMLVGNKGQSTQTQVLLQDVTALHSWLNKYHLCALNCPGESHEALLKEAGLEGPDYTDCRLDSAISDALVKAISNFYSNFAVPQLYPVAHEQMVAQEEFNTRMRVDKGTVDAENASKYSSLATAFEKLSTQLKSVAEILDLPPPKLPGEESESKTRLTGPSQEASKKEDGGGLSEQERMLQLLWVDDSDRSFYEDLYDLEARLPPVLLRDVPKADADAETTAKGGTTAASAAFDVWLDNLRTCERRDTADELSQKWFEEGLNTKQNRRKLARFILNPRDKARGTVPPEWLRVVANIAPWAKDLVDALASQALKRLDEALAKNETDRVGEQMVCLRLLAQMCKFRLVPPGAVMDFFKRLMDGGHLANDHWAEMASQLCLSCGRYLLYKPDTATRMDNLVERMWKLKNSATQALTASADVSLEDAYFHMKPRKTRFGVKGGDQDRPIMERLIRKFIFQDIYIMDEDEGLRLARKLPWEHHVIEENGTVKIGEKCNEEDSEVYKWMNECVLDLNVHANYDCMYSLASLLSGLARFRPRFVIEVVDELMEEIQIGCEREDPRESSARVRQIKLIGELYIYCVLDSATIFDLLYHLIGFGGATSFAASTADTAARTLEKCQIATGGPMGAIAEEDEEEGEDGEDEDGSDSLNSKALLLPDVFRDPSNIDEPPYSFFRATLVCNLLSACGPYFYKSSRLRERLERFMLFFRRYLLARSTAAGMELPRRVENMYLDTLDAIHPTSSHKSRRERRRRRKGKEEEEEPSVLNGKVSSLTDVDKELHKMLLTEGEALRQGKQIDDQGNDDDDEYEEDEEDDDAYASSSQVDGMASDEFGDEDDEEDDEDELREKELMDEEFDRSFKEMLSESVAYGRSQRQQQAPLRSLQDDRLRQALSTVRVAELSNKTDSQSPPSEAPLKPGMMKFVMRTNKKGVSTAGSGVIGLAVPSTSKLVRGQAEYEEHRQKKEQERAAIKELTIKHIDVMEQSGSQEESSTPPAVRYNFERRRRSRGSSKPLRPGRLDDFIGQGYLPEPDRQRPIRPTAPHSSTATGGPSFPMQPGSKRTLAEQRNRPGSRGGSRFGGNRY